MKTNYLKVLETKNKPIEGKPDILSPIEPRSRQPKLNDMATDKTLNRPTTFSTYTKKSRHAGSLHLSANVNQ